MTLKNQWSNPKFIGITAGIIGAIALLITPLLTTKGPLQITPIPIVLFAALVVMTRFAPAKPTFKQLLHTSILTLSVMLGFWYILLGTEQGVMFEMSAWDHVWRLAFIAGLALVSSLIAAGLVRAVSR